MRNRYSVIAVLSLLCLQALSAPAQTSAPVKSSSSVALESRVDSLLGQMTLEEKIDMLGGVDRFFIRDPDGNRIEMLHWHKPYDPAAR